MHLLDMTNNRANMAFCIGQPCWHGLGTPTDPALSPQEWWNVATGGQPWDVDVAPDGYFYNGKWHQTDHKHIVRSDNGKNLTTHSVSKIYKPHTIAQLLEFTERVCREAGYSMNTLISLDEGRKLVCLAEEGHTHFIGGTGRSLLSDQTGDKIKTYVLIVTSFDATMTTTISVTKIRVVCNNTLQLALGNRDVLLNVTHRDAFNVDAIFSQMQIIEKANYTFENQANTLVDTPLSDNDITRFFLDVASRGTLDEHSIRELDKDDLSVVRQRMTKYSQFYKTGPGQDLITASNTAWGAVNAVLGAVDHSGTEKGRAGRFKSAFFGTGRETKRYAWEAALRLAA